MTLNIACPTCGKTEGLKGEPSPEGIRIRCGSCGETWLRDEQLERCATCGGEDLVRRASALTQYSRGTQLSIVGIGEIILCRECDAPMLEWAEGSRAVPHSYRPAATDPDAAAERRDEGDGDVLITP